MSVLRYYDLLRTPRHDSCRNQAIALRTRSVSVMGILRQLAMLGDVGPLFDDGRSKITVRLGF